MTVYAVVHLSGSMIYTETGENLPSDTSYRRTIDLLRKIALYAKKKGGSPLITYIGKRMVLQSDMKHEDPHRETQKIVSDMAYLNDQLEALAKEHTITNDDTILLFSTAGDYLANISNKPPCHMQLILMDLVYDAINQNEFADLQKLVDFSLDEKTKAVRLKEFRTLHFCKAKPGEILYRLLKDHFMPFTVRIWVGRMKHNVMLSPKCPDIPKGNLHCVGFVKSSSLLNMPVISKHDIVPSTMISISRKEFKEQEKRKYKREQLFILLSYVSFRKKRKLTVAKKISNQKCKKKYLPLMFMLRESLIKEDCVAIVRFISGQYCAIYAIKEDTESETPEQFGLALLDVMQEFDFDKLVPKLELAKAKDDGVQDMHNNKLWDYTPSYINQTEKCWTSSQGMNVDLQKAVRLLKKLPEKPENLYAEINRMRDYAILLGMFEFVHTLAEILKTQIATLSEPAQIHANHIVSFLEKPPRRTSLESSRSRVLTGMSVFLKIKTSVPIDTTAITAIVMIATMIGIVVIVNKLQHGKVMIRMTTRLLFILLLAIFGIPLYLILKHSDEGRNVNGFWKNVAHSGEDDSGTFSYGVIMDAGSTGTRLFLYKWTSSSDTDLIDIKPALDDVGKPVVMKVYPGLSTFASMPGEAANYVKPLLDYVIKFIPDSQREYTPVFLFATAGMRLIPLEAQTAILHDLHSKLPDMTPMQIMKEHIRVIEGKWEGIYSWVAVNYILGKFVRTSTKADLETNRIHVERKTTVGMIDMGGASCQIAYELPQNDTFFSENINLGSREELTDFKYKLYVTTFLGYGVNEGLRKYEQHLSDTVTKANLSYVRDECMPVNLQKTITREDNSSFVRKGIGSWGDCVTKLSEMVSSVKGLAKSCLPSCFFGSVSLSDMDFYGFSEYWYSVQDVLALGGKYNYTHLKIKSNQFCSQRWSAIQEASRKALYAKADADRLKTQCFKSAWITAVLHSGFSISQETSRFQSANQIDGQEVQWALGAMIYHMRFFPLKNIGFNLVVNKHPDVSRSPPPIVVLLLAACCIICLFFTYTTLTKNPRITPGMRRSQSLWSYMAVPMEDSVSNY